MTLSFAVVKPLMLSWSTDRPWFLTVGMTASSEEACTMAFQLDDCVAISFTIYDAATCRGGHVEAVILFPRIKDECTKWMKERSTILFFSSHKAS